jgi:hypothetical protein
MGCPSKVAVSCALGATSPLLKTWPKVTGTSACDWPASLTTLSVTTVPAWADAAPQSNSAPAHAHANEALPLRLSDLRSAHLFDGLFLIMLFALPDRVL